MGKKKDIVAINSVASKSRQKQIEYWQKRAESVVVSGEKDALKVANELKVNYRKAVKEIENKINQFYGKFASENGMTLDEAKKLLNRTELKSFKSYLADIIKLGPKENLTDSQLAKYKKLYAKAKISRLDELETNIQYEIDKLTGMNEEQIERMLSNGYEDTYYRTMYNVDKFKGFSSSFSSLNNNMVEKAVNQKYLGDNFATRLYKNEANLLTILNQEIPRGLTLGYNPRKLADITSKKLNTNYNNTVRLIRTEYNRIMNDSTLDGYKASGITQYKILATLDERTCSDCGPLDSTVVDVSDGETGVTLPPFHANCYDSITEVYTNNGWKLFRELSKDDLIYTINPDTLIPEFEKPLNYIGYHYNGKMLQMTHRFFDLCVTPNHNIWIKYRDHKSEGKFRFVEASKMPRWNNLIYRSCKWIGSRPNAIKLGKYNVSPELYCKFMAYYLADGCYIARSDVSKGYAINISQRTYTDKMYEELKELPVNLRKTADGLFFNDESIYKYVEQFGRCSEKYIPQEIKNSDPELINLFLESYAITDGHKSKGKVWDGYKTSGSTSYFTTSKRLADDLGELILKCGRRPTFSMVKSSGKSCFDGKYEQNYDLWIVYDNASVYARTENIVVSEIDYNDFVYCVELEKYHTLLVRRNGQICWCGNCRCTTIPYFEPDEFDVDDYVIRNENGKVYSVPLNTTYDEWKADLQKVSDSKIQYK